MTTALLYDEKKNSHSRRLHGMLVPEQPRKGRGGDHPMQLVTADGREYRIVPDAKGQRMRGLAWLNVEVEGEVFEFASGARLLKVEHYHGEDTILDLDSDDIATDDDWAAEVRPEDVQADANGIYG